MNYYCRGCRSVVIGSQWCPRCQAWTPYRSANRTEIEELREAGPDVAQAAQAAQAVQPVQAAQAAAVGQKRMRSGGPSAAAAAQPAPIHDSSYALFHTMGRSIAGPHHGDGAYSGWLQDGFMLRRSDRGCVMVQPLRYQGAAGNVKRESMAEQQLRLAILPSFREALAAAPMRRTRNVIVNWHVRRTGTLNGHTGRGLCERTVAELRNVAEAAGKRLHMLYTVHEYTDLREYLIRPDAIVSLNPDLHRGLVRDFGERIPVFASRVPGLMAAYHTTSLDEIMRFVHGPPGSRGFVDALPLCLRDPNMSVPIWQFSGGNEASNILGACLHQQLRMNNFCTAQPRLRATQGVVIFSMMQKRHGLSAQVVAALAAALRGFPPHFKVILTGKPSEAALVKDLRALAAREPRVVFHGLLDSMHDIADCRYAISFDPLGYRSNASSMVALLRSGHLLFHSGGRETSEQLIARATRLMRMCENNESFYLQLLSHRQPLVLGNDPLLAIDDLDQMLRTLAARAAPQPAAAAAAAAAAGAGGGAARPAFAATTSASAASADLMLD